GGRTDRAAGCLTEQPGPSLVCQDGLWVIAGANPARPTSTQSSRDECPPPAPGSDWTCEDGAWVPPDEPGRQPVPPARPEPGDPDQVPPTPPEPGDPEPVPPAPPGPGTPDPVPPTPPQPGGPDPVPPAPPSPGQPVPIPPAPPQPPTPIPPAARGACRSPGSDGRRIGVHPRRAVLPTQQRVGFLVARHASGRMIPGERSPELHRQVGQDAGRGRDIAFLD